VNLDWLEKKMEDGCTDVSIHRLATCWHVEFRFAGVPESCGGKRWFQGKTMAEALEAARKGLSTSQSVSSVNS
jgi:hypothetical protein